MATTKKGEESPFQSQPLSKAWLKRHMKMRDDIFWENEQEIEANSIGKRKEKKPFSSGPNTTLRRRATGPKIAEQEREKAFKLAMNRAKALKLVMERENERSVAAKSREKKALQDLHDFQKLWEPLAKGRAKNQLYDAHNPMAQYRDAKLAGAQARQTSENVKTIAQILQKGVPNLDAPKSPTAKGG